MPTTPLRGHSPARGQDHRFRQLASELADGAVAATALADGSLALVARDADGAIRHVEVLDADGRPMRQTDALRVLGAARTQAQTIVEQTTEHAAAIVALALHAGDEDDVNMTTVARDLGVSRTTLYARVEDVNVAKPEGKGKGKR